MNQQVKKIRIGRQEKRILAFLKEHPEGVWKSEILDKFSWAKKYDAVLNARLQRMADKGLIEIRAEINPATGKSKQRVYLKQ